MKIRIVHGGREIEIEIPIKSADLSYTPNIANAIQLLKEAVASMIKLNEA